MWTPTSTASSATSSTSRPAPAAAAPTASAVPTCGARWARSSWCQAGASKPCRAATPSTTSRTPLLVDARVHAGEDGAAGPGHAGQLVEPGLRPREVVEDERRHGAVHGRRRERQPRHVGDDGRRPRRGLPPEHVRRQVGGERPRAGPGQLGAHQPGAGPRVQDHPPRQGSGVAPDERGRQRAVHERDVVRPGLGGAGVGVVGHGADATSAAAGRCRRTRARGTGAARAAS